VQDGHPINDTIPVPLVLEEISTEKLMSDYCVSNGTIVNKVLNKQSKDLKVAFVSVWGIACGISTYSKWLFDQIIPYVGEYKIFAEIKKDQENEKEENVIRCWERGKPLGQLIKTIEEFNPDVVLIQHEFGLFPSAGAWLSFITRMQKYKTFVTLHSTYKHKDKLICMAPIKNAIVHTQIAKSVLQDLFFPGTVSVIPHGSLPVTNEKPYFNIYYNEKTLMHFGFGFKYKGWETALEAVSILREKHENAFFTGIFSESPYNKQFHDTYYTSLQSEIDKYAIVDNAAIIRGYLPDSILESFLRVNKVAIFSYADNGEHTVYGCSGAARVAMHHNIPIVVSRVPLFDDLKDVCLTATTAKEFSEAVEMVWLDKKVRDAQLKKQQEFLKMTSWENVAKAYVELFIA